jgi:hypothetical protein
VSDLARGGQVVAGAGVHVAGLQDHDRRCLGSRIERPLQGVDVDRTVGIRLGRVHGGCSDPQEPQRPIHRRVPLLARDDPDPG